MQVQPLRQTGGRLRRSKKRATQMAGEKRRRVWPSSLAQCHLAAGHLAAPSFAVEVKFFVLCAFCRQFQLLLLLCNSCAADWAEKFHSEDKLWPVGEQSASSSVSLSLFLPRKHTLCQTVSETHSQEDRVTLLLEPRASNSWPDLARDCLWKEQHRRGFEVATFEVQRRSR